MGSRYPQTIDQLSALTTAEKQILEMHARVGANSTRLEPGALAEIGDLAEAMMTTARQLGWDELSRCTNEIANLVRITSSRQSPIMVRMRLGQMFFEMDRHISARKRALSSTGSF
jgi:hypothetical protein